MKDIYNEIGKYNSIYRGFVTWNDDPAVKGRLKIFVPGVYSDVYVTKPELLPWANPAMSSFGGNSINPNASADKLLNDETGWSSAPHAGDAEIGAQVYVFFEGGDINYPVYFAFAQSGSGWLAEHPNQHVFKSDNVRIRIDENVKDERSTCKFDSYNSKNSKVSKANLERDCTKHKWTFDQEKGVIKDLETRIDIEVLAENLNAINLNIHGNVNMKLDGNWFIEHYGNRYEYHEGDTYIKQKGSTYIEQEGVVREKLEGDRSVEHIGHYYLTHNGDTLETHTGSYFMMVDGDVTFTFNSEYKLTVGKNYSETVKLSKTADIFGSKNLNIYESYNEIIANNKFISAEGFYDLLVGESITTKSYRGNILLETEGDFELTKDGKITPVGFTNIGTKGNIQIISTFGNINLQCKKDDSKAQFNKKCITLPWNPSFVTQLEKMAAFYPDFNKTDSILGAEALNTDLDLTSFDITKFVKLFKEFTTSLLIYDGLPVFLPTRMIVQNPNIPIPKNANDVSWIPNFRSEAKDWKNISPSDFWKLPGRLMGNINIETWSGDISIKTNSELGCAGNITIEATESAGTLPGYKIGTVNIKNSGKNRIYPDPRDLFLDSDFQSRMEGQFKLFKHATNFTDPFRRSVLPTVVDSILKEYTGCSFDWVGTNYDDFYKLYATQIVTKGNMGALSPTTLKKLEEMVKKPGPKLGCPKCISDYLFGIPGVQDVCYASEIFEHFASESFIPGHKGFHGYGFFKFNPFDRDNPRGTFNILSLDFDKISMGDGHAIDMGFIDKEFVGPNIGAFTINTSGNFSQIVGRNYSFSANASQPKGTKTVSYTYTEKWYDTVWPSVLKESFKAINSVWNNSIGLLATIKDGDLLLIKGLINIPLGFYFLDFPLPENKFMVLGETTLESESLGGEVTSSHTFGYTCDIDWGFKFESDIKKLIENPDSIFKVGTLRFTDKEFNISTSSDTTKHERNEITTRNFSLKLWTPFNLNINKTESYKNSTSYKRHYDVVNGRDEFNLDWNINMIAWGAFPLIPFPKYYWKTNDNQTIKEGHGYEFSRDFMSYREYWSKSEALEIEPNPIRDPKETYVDYTENLQKTVLEENYAEAKPRDINISTKYLAGRDINENMLKNAPDGDININITYNALVAGSSSSEVYSLNGVDVNGVSWNDLSCLTSYIIRGYGNINTNTIYNADVDIDEDFNKNAGLDILMTDDFHAGRNISGEQFYTAIRSNDENIVWKSAINTNIRTLKSVGYFQDGDRKISNNNITVKLIGSDENPGGTNELVYDANKFLTNEIFINNGPSGVIDNSSNKIEVNNGNATKGTKDNNVKNEIFINNGKNVQFGTNSIKFENGTGGQRSINTNRYVINNGYGGTSGTVSVYDVYNGDAYTSNKMYTRIDWDDQKKKDLIGTCITEYSYVEKISNIGVKETKNVGSAQTINVGNIQQVNIGSTQNTIIGTQQTIDIGMALSTVIGEEQTLIIGKTQNIKIGETQNTIIGTSKTIDVPTYTFNTTQMTMNNKNSTSINTLTYTLKSGNCNITSSSAGSWKAPSLTLKNVNSLGTHNGLGNLKGEFIGTFMGAAGPDSEHSYLSDTGGVSASEVPVPSITLEPPSIDDPAEFGEMNLKTPPTVKTPQTPYSFTALLKLYVKYLEDEFKYLINIFK